MVSSDGFTTTIPGNLHPVQPFNREERPLSFQQQGSPSALGLEFLQIPSLLGLFHAPTWEPHFNRSRSRASPGTTPSLSSPGVRDGLCTCDTSPHPTLPLHSRSCCSLPGYPSHTLTSADAKASNYCQLSSPVEVSQLLIHALYTAEIPCSLRCWQRKT